ncbi:MAG TPA: hypothetical protein VGO59_20315 [Verrucomicrobiae bacterium]|jgi:hypothetical protein
MNTNSALIVPAPSAAANSAALTFHQAIKPLIEIPNGWLWVIWISVILALCLGAWLFWRYRNRKAAAAPAAPPAPPHIRARHALEAALALLSDPKAFSTAVSGAIREYLEDRFNFHAPDRTTEEFLYELQATNLLTAEQKLRLGEFLANCDLIKFAKYEPTEVELRGLHAAALKLVNETEPRWAPAEIQSTASAAP